MTTEEFWIWGRHPVLEALQTGAATQVLLSVGRDGLPLAREVRDAAAQADVRVKTIPPTEMDRLAAGQNTQGAMAQVTKEIAAGARDLLSEVRGPALILALDQIQDPHNVGALLRTASAAGANGVLLPDRRSAPLSGVVAKTSAGALVHLPIARVTNLNRALLDLREAGLWIVGLDGAGDELLYDVDLTVPLVLVVGSEGGGMRRLTRERCDRVVRLPMLGRAESLNASVAGGIALYEAARQRLVGGESGL